MALWHLEGSLDETGKIKKIPIDKSPFIIGRSKSLDMVVTRSGISREHAELINRDGRLFLRDLQSTNGTFVNKQRIKSEVLLTHNTVIHFAQFDFRLVDEEYKASGDEMSTVVMSIDQVRELQEKSAKGIPVKNSKPESEDAKQAVKPKKAPPSSPPPSAASQAAPEPKAKTMDEPPSSSKKIEEAAKPSKPASSVPSAHADDGNIFVQGSGDYHCRRSQPRREVRWPALITFKNQQTLQCTTKDISEVGLGLKTTVDIKENTLIHVKISVFFKGRTREINMIGLVKHSRMTTDGFIIGMHIKSCPKNASEFITKFSNHQL